MTPFRSLSLRALAACFVVLAGCGGDGPIEPEGEVATVTLTPSSPVVEAGATQRFSVTAKDSDGNNLLGLSVTWASSDPLIASVDATGLATALAVGSTEISATIGGVRGSQTLQVVADQCDSRVELNLQPGEFQELPTSQCFLLPSGAAGDRYRVVVARPTEIEDAADVVEMTLETTSVGSQAAAMGTAETGPGPSPVATADQLSTLTGPMLETLRWKAATRQAHARIHEIERHWDMPLAPRRPAFRAPSGALADPPEILTLNTKFGRSCSDTETEEHTLVAFNDDLAIYQDVLQNATQPISASAAQRLLDYFSSYAKPAVTDYFGEIPDIDGNGRFVVTTSQTLPANATAYVTSADLRDQSSCPGGNEMDIAYYSLPILQAMDASANPNFVALGTIAHEAKHVVSAYNRIAADDGRPFQPIWIEEGTAEIAGEMSSRYAWADAGGPALGTAVVEDDFRDNYFSNGEWWGPDAYYAVSLMAEVVVTTESQPNSVIVNPTGAEEGHNFYATSWVFHRFIGDAFGNATTPKADGALFRTLTATSTAWGTAGLAQVTGRSFDALFGDFMVALGLHGTGGPAPSRTITTWELAETTDLWGSGPLAPPGTWPWPVTTNPSTGEVSAAFTTNEYTGSLGPSGFRVHDFTSSGVGAGLQVEVRLSGDAKLVVTRIR